MPKKLADMGCKTDNCDEFWLTEGMRERKAKLDEISDGVIALAGGFGTQEELSEMIGIACTMCLTAMNLLKYTGLSLPV